MSFASTGIYTGPSGSTDAAPGDVIRSATWNTINTDYASALTTLAQNAWTPVAATITSGPYTIATTDAALIFNMTVSATVAMPTASSYSGRWLRMKSIGTIVVASATVVIPLSTSTLGTTILTGSGKWAALQSNGTSWVVMMSN